MPRTAPTLLTLIAVLLTLPGCAAAVPLVSAGAAAGEAGYSFWRSGMLTYVDEGTHEEMSMALSRTLDRLALTIHETRVHVVDDDDGDNDNLNRSWWSIRSDTGHLVTIKITPLTEAMVEVKIDAGAFGNKAAAELIADRLKAELDEIQTASELQPTND